MLRVLLMDSEEIYLRGLESVLSTQSGLEIESILLHAGVRVPEMSRRFDLVVVGISDGGWRSVRPALLSVSAYCDRSLAVVSGSSRSHIRDILRADVDSFVHRSASASTLSRAILHTAGGHRYVDEPIGVWLLSEAASRWSPFNLTSREREIADLLMTDLTLTHVASHLRISHNTVKYHVAHIYRKVGVQGRRDLRDIGGSPG